MVKLKYSVSKVKLQVCFGTIINTVTSQEGKIMEDRSLLVRNGIPQLQHDLAGGTQAFHRILVAAREVNTIISIHCGNVGGREEKYK